MKLNRLFILAAVATPVVFSACHKGDDKSQKEEAPAIDLAAMDTTVAPQNDFYDYVNGGWIAANPLKDEYGRYGTFDLLRDSAQNKVKEIILEMSKEDLEPNSDAYKAALLYNMSMDSVKLNEQGAEPIKADIQKLDSIKSKEELVKYLANEGNLGDSYFFGTYVYADNEDSNKNILNLVQSGSIMGNRDYYLDKSFEKYRTAYVDYMAKLFEMVGMPKDECQAKAKELLKVETSLVKLEYSNLELRDVQRNYNKMSRDAFFKQFSFPWETYFNGRDLIKDFKEINVGQKDFFSAFDRWFQTTSLDDLKLFVLGQMLDGASGYLSDDFREAAFDFHGKTIGGRKMMKPRWKTAVARVNGSFGHVVGQAYTKKYFPPEAKDKMITLIANLKSALSQRINGLEWMSDETKAKAQAKLAKFHVKVGYPDKWDTYEKVDVDTTSLYAYIKDISKYKTEHNAEDINKPVDKDKWLMNPHDVNAYYNPATNEICFPAAILQPPFFNMNADDAVNYGAIGVVIGHEMTHGFDDQGSQFDENGNMVNWWTKEDAERFKEATQKLADQYSQIVVLDSLHADGKLTLGENIADQGGLLVAHLAMKNAVPADAPKIDGFTPDQRFFIAYGRLWGQNIRNEEIINLTKNDVHSLGKWRVNQALRNIPSFYEAFGIKEGDGMWLAPEDRVQVW